MGQNLSYHERLGGNAIGDTYRVTWKSSEHGTIQASATKIRNNGQIGEKIQREINYLKQLDHMNVIKCYTMIPVRPFAVIISEYAPKGSLFDYLKDKLTIHGKLIQRWVFHLARGMEYLNEKGITQHRTLRSRNCFISAKDELKIQLCDFSIVDILNLDNQDKSSSKKTSSPAIFDITAIPQIQDLDIFKYQNQFPKANIFAFAIIVWEMLTCEEPERGLQPDAIHLHRAPMMIGDLRPDIPDDCTPFLKSLVEQCWHVDFEKRPAIDVVVRRLRREYEKKLAENDDLVWRPNHEIHSNGELGFVDCDRVAICREDSRNVEIRMLTREESRLLYTLTSEEWKGVVCPRHVAVHGSSILVICNNSQNVYQFHCRESSEFVSKHQIHDQELVGAWCIAANSKLAVVGLDGMHKLAVYELPQFDKHRMLSVGFIPYDISMNEDNVVIMGRHETVVKSLEFLHRYLFKIQAPTGWEFRGVALGSHPRQVFVVCYHNEKDTSRVYKYTWGGKGTNRHDHTMCVVVIEGEGQFRGFSITKEGLMAMSVIGKNIQCFSLEY